MSVASRGVRRAGAGPQRSALIVQVSRGRQASAAIALELLDDPETTQREYLQYLKYRADQSKSTRFVGAVITTLQGVATVTVGLEMALAKGSQYTTTGWVLTGLGLASTGIGAVHFFGKTRAQRELHKALHPDDPVSNFSLDAGPTLVMGPRGELAPGLLAVGTF